MTQEQLIFLKSFVILSLDLQQVKKRHDTQHNDTLHYGTTNTIMTLIIMQLSIPTNNTMTLIIMTLSMLTNSIITSYYNGTLHHDYECNFIQHSNKMSSAECCCAECRGASRDF